MYINLSLFTKIHQLYESFIQSISFLAKNHIFIAEILRLVLLVPNANNPINYY
jgi:hypothetical protein